MRRLLFVGILLTVVLSTAVESLSQGFLPLAIYPSALYLRFPDDRVYENELLIKNKSEERVEIGIELRDFTIATDGTFLSSEPNVANENSLAPFVTYSPSVVTLDPGEQTKIYYRIELPEGSVGPFWGTLVVAPVEASRVSSTEEDEQGTSFGVLAKMIYPFAIMVHATEDVEPRAEIIASDIWLSDRHGRDVLNARFEISNQCQDILCCAYTLRFFNEAGEMIDETSDPTYRVILPGMTRPFSKMYIADYLPPGTYTVEISIDYEAAIPLVGELSLELGEI